MTFRNRKRLGIPLAGALLALGTMVIVSNAMATHPRPQSATPFRIPLVTYMKQCTAATGDPAGLTHGGTLSFPSCQVGSPGTIGGPASNNISVGSPGSQAPAPAQGGGYVLLCTSTGCGTPPTLPAGGGDVQIESVGTDVRCVPGGATSCSPAGSNGAQTTTDYIGQVRGTSIIRITDHNNGAPGYTTSGTVSDLPFTVDGACAANPGTGSAGAPIGGTCSVHTTSNTVVPGAGVPGKLGIVQVGVGDGTPGSGGIVVTDGGPDGNVANTTDGPNKNFASQGILIP